MKAWSIAIILLITVFLQNAEGQIKREEPKPHPECPTGPNEDPVHPVHLRYPGNCTKFYKCLRGLAYPHDCPGGLYWSHNNINCLWAGQEDPPCPF
ncbi:peritrophin-1-like [Condylostylus longicornis]|uniref:peritrophin-1-like n=1 Tax=Condylostylus longicornis TaxID=2530218 RepID=UPI00244DC50E|nr:peritrophin-1-like [Condylostylus longicornis]